MLGSVPRPPRINCGAPRPKGVSKSGTSWMITRLPPAPWWGNLGCFNKEFHEIFLFAILVVTMWWGSIPNMATRILELNLNLWSSQACPLNKQYELSHSHIKNQKPNCTIPKLTWTLEDASLFETANTSISPSCLYCSKAVFFLWWNLENKAHYLWPNHTPYGCLTSTIRMMMMMLMMIMMMIMITVIIITTVLLYIIHPKNGVVLPTSKGTTSSALLF